MFITILKKTHDYIFLVYSPSSPPPALINGEIPYQELYSILVEVICFFNQNMVTYLKQFPHCLQNSKWIS